MMDIDPVRALERARGHCFLSGVGDAGEALCGANMPFGIAKIHFLQKKLGYPADATFIGAPDATVTRNQARWAQGFGYGGRIQWSGDFAVLDIKSNACGMIVAALEQTPSPAEIRERAERLIREPLEVDGIAVEFDLAEGNHFLDVCQLRETEQDVTLPSSSIAVIHSSGHEHRERTPQGPGIYYDESTALRALAEEHETPWGTLHVLQGDRARDWYEIYDWVQHFSVKRREALARALLGPLEVIANRTHQGLLRINDAILGCYVFTDEDLSRGQLFPLTLGPDLPVYLVKPLQNLDEAALELAGFADRARRHGVLNRLRQANLLPHGGGYSYAEFTGVSRVVESGGGRRSFEMVRRDRGVELVDDVRSTAYGYRGDEVRKRMVELGLGETCARADITYVLRM